MPNFAAIAANMTKSSKNSGTLAVMPLVLTSVAVTGYARSTAAHHMQSLQKDTPQHQAEELAHDAEVFHQHVVYPWKGTR